jgi:hypothetical protein
LTYVFLKGQREKKVTGLNLFEVGGTDGVALKVGFWVCLGF